MSKVYLYGKLGKQFGKEYNLQVSSPREAVIALSTQIPHFRNHFEANKFYIRVGDDTNIEEETLDLNTHRDIHIFP